MVSIHDVASYILHHLTQKWEGVESVQPNKMQALLYYSQAWSLAWRDEPLFNEPLEAWYYGPGNPDFYNHYKAQGQTALTQWPWGSASHLNDEERDVVERMLEFYADKDMQELFEILCEEEPFQMAYAQLEHSETGSVVIDLDTMQEYYEELADQIQEIQPAEYADELLEELLLKAPHGVALTPEQCSEIEKLEIRMQEEAEEMSLQEDLFGDELQSDEQLALEIQQLEKAKPRILKQLSPDDQVNFEEALAKLKAAAQGVMDLEEELEALSIMASKDPEAKQAGEALVEGPAAPIKKIKTDEVIDLSDFDLRSEDVWQDMSQTRH